MKTVDINIRDPYVLTFENKYYLYGTRAEFTWKAPDNLNKLGFDVYISDDLENWEKKEVFSWYPGFWSNEKFWAPEVHRYQDKFYMFATFGNSSQNRCKGTQILVSNKPDGPFKAHTDLPLTPKEWECLDGTLYIEQEKPYLVFCHEWQQIGVGEICVMELSKDLKTTISEPITILKANENSWADSDSKTARYVTDGPFLFSKDKRIYMIWSSLVNDKYVEAVSYSDDGIMSNFKTYNKLLFSEDGGHGMVFKTFNGERLFTLHTPNVYLKEHPIFIPIAIDSKGLHLK